MLKSDDIPCPECFKVASASAWKNSGGKCTSNGCKGIIYPDLQVCFTFASTPLPTKVVQ